MRVDVNIGIRRKGKGKGTDYRLTGCGSSVYCTQNTGLKMEDAVLCDSDCAGKKRSLRGQTFIRTI